jgi:predicted O-methyltransferase YrrM
MPSLFHYAKHELHMAWRRWQIRRSAIPTGLADSAWLLHGLVRSMKPLTCVEIGSAHGYSTCLIGLALKQNLRGRLWAVDPHELTAWNDDQPEHTFDSLRRNLRRAGVENQVEIVRKRTIDAAADLPASIDFAFIDGDHSYEGVKQDWSILAPRMQEYGVVVFHDTMWDRHAEDPYYRKWRRDGMGVPRFLEELRKQGYPMVTIDQDWGLTLVQSRVGGNPFAPLFPSPS